MKKFAAHYLFTDNGLLLKNGIAVANNKTFQFIDTGGELTEIEQMIFHSGLMIGAFEFIKQDDFASANSTGNLPLLLDQVLSKDHLSLIEIIDLVRQLQDSFPEKNIPDLLNKIEQVLLSNGFIKQTIPALYLLSGLDLKTLRLTDTTRLKKVA